MTITPPLRWVFIAGVTLFSITAGAQEKCPPTPEKYRHLEFGDVRFAIEENCRSTFSQNEQFFLAGIAHALRSRCRLPRDADGRALMEQFAKAATLSLDIRKRQEPLHDRVPAQPGRAAAFAAGTSMMEEIRCNGPEAALLARGLVIHLRRTSSSSRFVAGCVEFYAARYTRKQCRCLADGVRSVVPDVDRRFFDREIVKGSIHDSPSIALRLMGACGIAKY